MSGRAWTEGAAGHQHQRDPRQRQSLRSPRGEDQLAGAARAKGGQGVGNDKPEGGAEEKTGTHSSSSSTRFSVSADAFGGAPLGGSLNERKVAAWCKDPVVTFEGGRTSLRLARGEL